MIEHCLRCTQWAQQDWIANFEPDPLEYEPAWHKLQMDEIVAPENRNATGQRNLKLNIAVWLNDIGTWGTGISSSDA